MEGASEWKLQSDLLSAVITLSSLPIPLWLRILTLAVAIVAALRITKHAFAIFSFYSVTAGMVIEEVKKSSPILNAWDKRKRGEPFFQLDPKVSTGFSNSSTEPKMATPIPANESETTHE
jgi:hypothetical protein